MAGSKTDPPYGNLINKEAICQYFTLTAKKVATYLAFHKKPQKGSEWDTRASTKSSNPQQIW